MAAESPLFAFLRAACVPVNSWHEGGDLVEAEAVRAAHPAVAHADIHAAAVLGDEVAVRGFLAGDPGAARATGGPHGWDALTHLCFSRYLRLERARTPGFVAAATALLDAGADANTGFVSDGEREAVIYGAAGVARNAPLTRLLLARGADPNDGETEYHAPETVHDEAMWAVVESGKLEDEGLTTMLHRKLDWHHWQGVAWLLDHGADPNRPNHPWKCSSAFHHALDRCNDLRVFGLLLDHGGDPTRPAQYQESASARAARRGRGDVLDAFAARGFVEALLGDDAFFAACTRGDAAVARAAVAKEPGLVARLEAADPGSVAEFAGAGNLAGVALLLDLGFALESRTARGGMRDATPLHYAIWRGRLAMVKLLLARGADVTARTWGVTSLGLARRALNEQSDWTPHGSNEIVDALVAAGAPE